MDDRAYIQQAADRFLRRFVNLLIFLVPATAILNYCWWGLPPVGPSLAALSVGVMARIAIHLGRLMAARVILVGALSAIVCFTPFVVNGVRSPIILGWPMVLMLCAWMLGNRALAVLTTIALASVMVLGAAELYWLHQWPEPPRTTDAWVSSFSLITVLTVVVIWQMLRNYGAVQQHDQEMRRQLDVANAALVDKLEFRSQQLDRSDGALNQVRADYERVYPMAMMAGVIPSVTHDINTPVGNTGMAASTLSAALVAFKRQLEGGTLRRNDLDAFLATVGEGLAIIQTANQRAGALVSSLKQMSIDQVTQQRRTFDLGHLIDEVLTALGPSIKKHGVAVVKEIESEISMNSFPGPLEQIITNLVQNALVHGFDGRSSGTIIVRGQLVGEQQVRLEVQDDGAGMTADAQARLFEPFFTTRAGMGGSGIGLTSSKKLVEETLCGQIRVETAQGSGTRFTLDLPLNPQRLLSTGTA